MQQLATHLVDAADETLRAADAMVLPPGILGDLPHRRLFSDDWLTESFLALPFLVSAVRGVGLIQKRLADRLAPAAGVRVLPCPFEAVPLIEALWWHPMYTRDAGHGWLRDIFVRAGTGLEAIAPQ